MQIVRDLISTDLVREAQSIPHAVKQAQILLKSTPAALTSNHAPATELQGLEERQEALHAF